MLKMSKNNRQFSTDNVYFWKCQKYRNFWHFPVDFGLSVRFLTYFCEIFDCWKQGSCTGLVLTMEIPENPKYRESWKAENFWQTHCLNFISWKCEIIEKIIWLILKCVRVFSGTVKLGCYEHAWGWMFLFAKAIFVRYNRFFRYNRFCLL